MQRAFTLLEVMFAILILGIGLIAVAGIFPIAGGIQRDTMQKEEAVLFGANMNNFLRTVPLRASAYPGPADGVVYNFSSVAADQKTDPQIDAMGLVMDDRSYPSTVPLTLAGPPVTANRPYYATPIFRKTPDGDYKIYVFILKRFGGVVPRVLNTGPANAGDVVVAPDGTVYSLTADTPNCTDWHAELFGNFSTFRDIVVVSGAVR